MSQKTKTPGPDDRTHVTINANGKAVPNPARISISANGGAKFNAAYPCTLKFKDPPGCPFANAVGPNLSLNQGDNDEPLKNGVPQQNYTFGVDPSQKPKHDVKKPFDEQFDVVVGA